MIETIFSTDSAPRWPQHLRRLAAMQRRDPFAPAAVELVAMISRLILRSELARELRELAALAHWFRPASLQSMAARATDEARGTQVRPRGLVFAIAPANVEVLFIYAWLLSLLAGNATVVRVSGKPSPLRDVFITLIRQLAQQPSYAEALGDSWIITYEHDTALSGTISAMCHARLVWGGDETIAAIRAVPLSPVALDLAFADRFSLAALDAATVRSQSDETLREIARRFVNDTLWFDQQACSSPRAVFWVGNHEDVTQARMRFWEAYRAAASAFADDPSSVMARIIDLFSLAAAGGIDALDTLPAQRPALAHGTPAIDAVRELHSGHGLFVEYAVTEVSEIAAMLHEHDQTLVAYGLSAEALSRLILALPNRALDRIVAPGHATEFSIVWDGANLLDVLTRKIVLSA